MTQPIQASSTFKVRVQPRASKDEILDYRGDALRVRVTAPPEAGKANDAVITLLSSALGIAKSRVRIVRGSTSRDKLVKVESLSLEEVRRRLSAVAG